MRLLNLRINFYLLRTFCPHLGSFCVVSPFTTFRPNFTSSLLQAILPRPRIGMLSLVTVSPVITAFHCCCLIAPCFWSSKPLAGLGRIWNRYLLTMLTSLPSLNLLCHSKPNARFMQDGRKAVWSIPYVLLKYPHIQIAFLKFTSCDNQALVGCIPILAIAVHLNLKS